MNEMDVLKNRWREAKGTRTFPDIAEAADLSPSTVEYAFSPKSTNPSIDTVVRISRELHVSLDETFGILSPSGRAETELAGRTPPTGSRGTNPPSGISNISAPSF